MPTPPVNPFEAAGDDDDHRGLLADNGGDECIYQEIPELLLPQQWVLDDDDDF